MKPFHLTTLLGISYNKIFICTLFFIHLTGNLFSEHYYFGYGSNFNADYLKNRCRKKGIYDEPVDLGAAILYDYAFSYSLNLAFYKKQGTAASVSPENGSKVYGALYQISDAILKELDFQEDVNKAYFRKELQVYNIPSKQMYSAWVYVGNPARLIQNVRPDPKYVDVIRSGARSRGVPEDYIENVIENLAIR